MAAEDSAEELVSAIHSGDVATVVRLLQERPELLSGPLGRGFGTRTALVAATDWPGYFPNGPEIVRILIAAGADPDGRAPGDETPLHWAASSDDAEVAAALIDGGADLEVPDGSIGTPLDNAIGYACWNVARLLVQRGARVDKLWHAAALGLLPRLEEIGRDPAPAGTGGDLTGLLARLCRRPTAVGGVPARAWRRSELGPRLRPRDPTGRRQWPGDAAGERHLLAAGPGCPVRRLRMTPHLAARPPTRTVCIYPKEACFSRR